MSVWIILLKNNFFGFPNVKWFQYTGKVSKCISYGCQIFSGIPHQKSLKLVNFWQSYWKNKKGGHFLWTQCILLCEKCTDKLNELGNGNCGSGTEAGTTPLGMERDGKAFQCKTLPSFSSLTLTC